MKREVLRPQGMCKPLGNYTHAVEVEGKRLLSIAGQVAADAQGNIVGKGDMRTQIKQVVDNLKTVLDAGGARFQDVIKTTIFTTSIEEYYKVNDVYAACFHGTPPPSTLVEIKRLAYPDMMIEIEALAVVDG